MHPPDDADAVLHIERDLSRRLELPILLHEFPDTKPRRLGLQQAADLEFRYLGADGRIARGPKPRELLADEERVAIGIAHAHDADRGMDSVDGTSHDRAPPGLRRHPLALGVLLPGGEPCLVAKDDKRGRETHVPRIALYNFCAGGLVALANLLDDADVQGTRNVREVATVPDLTGVEEMRDGFFKSWPDRDDHSCGAGLDELREKRIDVLEESALQPVRLPPPEVGIEKVHHLLPFESLLEKADVLPFRLSLGQVGLRITLRAQADCPKEIVVLHGEDRRR